MKLPELSPLASFILKVLLLLPVCLAVWYWLLTPLNTPLAWLSDFILTSLWGDVIEVIQLIGHQLDVTTSLAPPGEPNNTRATVILEVNPLIYSYSLPFAAALILATPASWVKKLIALLVAYLLLLLLQSWGVCFYIAKSLLYAHGPEINARLSFSVLAQALVGIAYQFGSLILPSLSPIVIWIALFRDFVLSIAPQIGVLEKDSTKE
jgi:hypothetical protein